VPTALQVTWGQLPGPIGLYLNESNALPETGAGLKAKAATAAMANAEIIHVLELFIIVFF